MDTVALKGTDLTVSRICLGTMTFGDQTDETVACRLVDHCLDAGVNFIDTANVYSQGAAERIVGNALKGRRDDVVLASKVRGRMGGNPDQSGLSRPAILRAVEESLRRLKTDYLDICYLHFPDYSVPLEESLRAMDGLVRQGKVRYPASSNYSAWQMCHMLCLAEREGFRPTVIAQPMYNLVARGIEQEFLPMTREFGISTVVYNPLAGGLLTGKQKRYAPLPGTRFEKNKQYMDRYWHSDMFDAVEELCSIAQVAGRSVISLALNWLLHHTGIDCTILGASRPEQLEENLKAVQEGALSKETVAACDTVWATLRGASPSYNR